MKTFKFIFFTFIFSTLICSCNPVDEEDYQTNIFENVQKTGEETEVEDGSKD